MSHPELFNYLYSHYGLILSDEELDSIVGIVLKHEEAVMPVNVQDLKYEDDVKEKLMDEV